MPKSNFETTDREALEFKTITRLIGFGLDHRVADPIDHVLHYSGMQIEIHVKAMHLRWLQRNHRGAFCALSAYRSRASLLCDPEIEYDVPDFPHFYMIAVGFKDHATSDAFDTYLREFDNPLR